MATNRNNLNTTEKKENQNTTNNDGFVNYLNDPKNKIKGNVYLGGKSNFSVIRGSADSMALLFPNGIPQILLDAANETENQIKKSQNTEDPKEAVVERTHAGGKIFSGKTTMFKAIDTDGDKLKNLLKADATEAGTIDYITREKVMNLRK